MKEIAHPNIVASDEWLTARKTLLEHEKALIRQRDRVNAERRRLPMVKYKDVVEFKHDNHCVLTSHILNDDGRWHKFMTANYWRKP